MAMFQLIWNEAVWYIKEQFSAKYLQRKRSYRMINELSLFDSAKFLYIYTYSSEWQVSEILTSSV